MNPPTASVIVCVYNRGASVRPCLDSILRSRGPAFEIVLVDDASTDDTPQILEGFRGRHPELPIRIARNAVNLGVSGARNAGLDAAQGDFVAFTDSDCVVDEGWLAALVARLRDGDVHFVGGAVESPLPRNQAERAYVGTSRIGRAGWQHRAVVGCNMAFHREKLAGFRFDDSLDYGCDEDDVTWRMRSAGCRGAFVPEARVMHHHRLTLRGYLRQAWRQGRGAARYWYKRGTYVGRDVLFGFLALAAMPLGLLDARLLIIPAAFALLQFAAIVFNEAVLKGKRFSEVIAVLPICVAYQLVKSASVLRTWAGLLLGGEQRIRESKREWCALQREGATLRRISR